MQWNQVLRFCENVCFWGEFFVILNLLQTGYYSNQDTYELNYFKGVNFIHKRKFSLGKMLIANIGAGSRGGRAVNNMMDTCIIGKHPRLPQQ
jgi:hypothetical protein